MKKGLKNSLLAIRFPFLPLLRRLSSAPKILLEEYPDHPVLFDMYRDYLSTGHQRVPGGWMYEKEFYPDYITVGGASKAIERTVLEFCTGTGIDVGASFWPLKGATQVDIASGAGVANRIEDIPQRSQNFVFSSHCLEHIEHWENALDAWASKIKVGGHLFLYLPHPSCKLWHKSDPLMSDTHKWIPEPSVVIKALRHRKFSIVDKDEEPDSFFSFFVCGKKRR